MVKTVADATKNNACNEMHWADTKDEYEGVKDRKGKEEVGVCWIGVGGKAVGAKGREKDGSQMLNGQNSQKFCDR